MLVVLDSSAGNTEYAGKNFPELSKFNFVAILNVMYYELKVLNTNE